ncbi:hypothetical protein SAMN04488601_1213 [Paenibacillus sp. 453mf]|nr:hypothetical protein SAMN04488601_1213 [Paenibacillus sp. 453mf]
MKITTVCNCEICNEKFIDGQVVAYDPDQDETICYACGLGSLNLESQIYVESAPVYH